MAKKNAATATAEATEITTTTEQPTEVKTAPKVKTPEQQASAMRRQAGELKRSAAALGENHPSNADLLLRATQLESDADALAPKKSGKSTEPRPQCSKLKKDGTQCTAKCMEGADTCTDHRPVRARFSDEQWAAFSRIDTATIVDALGWGVAVRMAKEQMESESK